VGYYLSAASQNQREDEDGVVHTLRSSGLLPLEASQASVSQSSLNTGGGTAWMVHVASSWRSSGDKAKDEQVHTMDCIGLFYPNFTVFVVLGYKSSLVISFSIIRTLGLVKRKPFSHSSLSSASYNCFLRGVGVLHGVREERK
jgi:hypothetical protein